MQWNKNYLFRKDFRKIRRHRQRQRRRQRQTQTQRQRQRQGQRQRQRMKKTQHVLYFRKAEDVRIDIKYDLFTKKFSQNFQEIFPKFSQHQHETFTKFSQNFRC